MNWTHTFRVAGSRGDEKIEAGPLDATAAVKRAIEMHYEGYSSIAFIDVETGERFEVERYMPVNTRTMH